MRWPIALGLLLLVATAAVGFGVAESDTPAPTSVTVDVSATQTGQPLPAGFVGFSLEYSAVHQYIGRDATALNPVFEQLVAALNPDQSPVLRIGGDSSDHTWWPQPGMVPPAGVNYALTDNWLASVHALAAKLNAKLILGVNLAADSPQLAGTEARALIHGIGGQYVDALEIGNEPDVYTQFAWYKTRTDKIGFARGNGWSEQTWQNEFRQWARALPDVPLAGPADAYPTWMADLSSFIASEPHLGVVTFHRYPLRGCGSEAVGALAGTIPNLLADSASADLAQSVQQYVSAAHAAKLPFRVDELNSASCEGAKGVSNTFTSSLWILDTLFNMASVGVDGVNIHTLPGSVYAPFSFSESHGVWHASVNPLYYGLLMFTQAFPAGGHLLDTSAPSGDVKVWSDVDSGGTVRTVVINKDPSVPATVHLHIQGAGAKPVSVESLTAPSLASTTGVQLGGQSFAANTTTGELGTPQTSEIKPSLGNYTVSVPAASAVLITS